MIVCPSCGSHFGRPFFTERKLGYGVTFGPLGDIKCPSCGFKASWGKFKKVGDLPKGDLGQESNSGSPTPPSPPTVNQTGQTRDDLAKQLDETKYDQE